jgi:hypothetical protein
VSCLCSKGPVWKSLCISAPRTSWSLFFSVSTATLTFAFLSKMQFAFHTPRTKVVEESGLLEYRRVLRCWWFARFYRIVVLSSLRVKKSDSLAPEDDSTAVGIFHPFTQWQRHVPEDITVITLKLANVLTISGLHDFSTFTHHVWVFQIYFENVPRLFPYCESYNPEMKYRRYIPVVNAGGEVAYITNAVCISPWTVL